MKTFKDYQLLTQQALSLIETENDLIANLSNISALLNMNMADINWVGFYLLKEDQLVLGPFQGNVACVRIALNKGVCGKSFSTNTVQRIADVHEFPGHIACDAASQSEIVVPIVPTLLFGGFSFTIANFFISLYGITIDAVGLLYSINL